ncbi:hypothetical protein [Psychrobacter sp. 230]|uniref:hypothetical protein n=1 Tax=Psychrobacter sp. 230 TaxID=2555884 RepID=UPI00141911F2|nr:hypothetical protein [Psychrobacter sp. 230]|tara:strand:- start:16080 stop:16241 length:162 start_codon:yes stop_codon:yes gene_type:complete
MQFNFIKTARQLTDIAIKNSEIVQPYIKANHYRRGLLVLNALHYALRIADKDK